MRILFIASTQASIEKHHSFIRSLEDYGYGKQDFVYIPELEIIHLAEIRKKYFLILTDGIFDNIDNKIINVENFDTLDLINEIKVFMDPS